MASSDDADWSVPVRDVDRSDGLASDVTRDSDAVKDDEADEVSFWLGWSRTSKALDSPRPTPPRLTGAARRASREGTPHGGWETGEARRGARRLPRTRAHR